jgi:putative FmdB family regulatory protein
MPIYEYICTACGHRLEALQKMSDAPLSDCPSCQAQALKKLMSAAGINVKSGGNEAAPACGAGACPACAID